MSVSTINTQDFITRIVAIFKNDSTIFPDTGESLVTDVLSNKPAIEQSAQTGLIPYIIVFESNQPIRDIEKVARDVSIDSEGGGLYEVEIYCVAVTNNELSAEIAQQKNNILTAAMRNALAKNLRLINPETSDDPLCRTHTRFQITYLLKGDVPATMRAYNVVIRAQVYVYQDGG